MDLSRYSITEITLFNEENRISFLFYQISYLVMVGDWIVLIYHWISCALVAFVLLR